MKQTINFLLFGISIILLGASLFLNISHTVITNESIVLVFVGILATFIVVGNYAQVIDIRNSTNTQINDLELKTRNKIEELNKLYVEMTETSNKLKKVEKNTDFNAAEAYRLYGAFCFDKEYYKNSSKYLLDAITLYYKINPIDDDSEKLLNIVLDNLQPENWNNIKQKYNEFDYQKYIGKVKELPDKYTQKQKIIDLLENYKNEDQKNKK